MLVMWVQEEKLFKKARKRDAAAFAELMASYQALLYKTAWRYLRDEQDALDALQEVSYRAFKNIHKVKQPEYVKTWLVRIMINYCLDEIKRKQRSVPVETFYEESPQEDPDTAQKLDIEQHIQDLDEKYQLIIVLKYYHQYTLKEIAESLEMPIGTVKTRLNRALELLRIDMGKGGELDAGDREEVK